MKRRQPGNAPFAIVKFDLLHFSQVEDTKTTSRDYSRAEAQRDSIHFLESDARVSTIHRHRIHLFRPLAGDGVFFSDVCGAISLSSNAMNSLTTYSGKVRV